MRTFGELDEQQREIAWARWLVLAPTVERAVPLTEAAAHAAVPLRTAQRWLMRYRAGGLAGLARPQRADQGVRRTRPELVALIEGLALGRPKPLVATIASRVRQAAADQGWPAPSYSTVHSIVAGVDPQLATLAHEGPSALRDRYELVYRRQAGWPNELWQADHTELDVLVVDGRGIPARPWLTVVLDDCSRAVAGYTVFLGAPSALNLSLALRQAIWHKTDPDWVVHGIPKALYTDHGSDFTSKHLAQVAADLHIEVINSAVGRPQGRGKVERLFGTIATELLAEMPGYLVDGKPVSPPALSLAELDDALTRWLSIYHHRVHRETGVAPQQAWLAQGWIPRMPDSLQDLDLLLVMVAKPRTVHRDGIRFQGLRYLHPSLASHVGQPVTIRYDPRDLREIRVFRHNKFICRAIGPDHAGEALTLAELQAARVAHRRALRDQLAQRRAAVAEYLPTHEGPPAQPAGRAAPKPTRPRTRLRIYKEDQA